MMSDNDWRIVPERDEAQARARTRTSGEPTKKAAASVKKQREMPPEKGPSRGAPTGLVVFVLLLTLASLGGNAFLYLQQQATIEENLLLDARVLDLEGQLSVTDESLSQSGAAMQAVLQNHEAELENHMSEIRKLWGVSYDTNRKAIDALKVSTTDLQATLETVSANAENALQGVQAMSGLGQQVDGLASQILIASADVEQLLSQYSQLEAGVNTQQSTLSQLQQTLAAQQDAIDAIDEYRLDINRRLLGVENAFRDANTL